MTFRLGMSFGGRLLFGAVLTFGCCTVAPSTALADSLSTAAQASSTGTLSSSNFVSNCPQSSQVPAGLAASACSNNVFIAGTDLSFAPALGSASATGSLAKGTVGAMAQTTLEPGITPGLTAAQQADLLALSALENGDGVGATTASSSAAISYDFAVTGPSSGTVAFTLRAQGSTNVTYADGGAGCTAILGGPRCQGTAGASVKISGPESFAGSPGSTSLFLQTGATPFTILIPYVNGIADLSLSLDVSASCAGTYAAGFGPGNGSLCSSTSDFFDTVSITGDSVYDANGNLVPGATLISDSGFNPNDIPTTPEPSSSLLLGMGLLALAGAAKLVRA